MSTVKSPWWAVLCVTALSLVNFSLAAASPVAVLDSSFAIGNGAGFPSDGGSFPQVSAVAVQSDGKVVAGGNLAFTNFNGTPIHNICRINTNGTLDTSFSANMGSGPFGDQSLTISKIVVQQDGKILIGGTFSAFAGYDRNGLVRLNSDGSVDTSFLAAGGGAGGTFAPNVATIALQSDGKIIIGGFFYSFGGTAVPSLARLNSDGTVDGSFAVPVTTGLSVGAVGVQPDGKIFVGGTFTSWNGFPTPGIVRLNADGSLDASFAPTHTTPFPSITALYAPGDGSVFVGGFVEGTLATTTRFFAHLNNDGSIDTAYPAPDGLPLDIEPWPAGGILIGGRFRNVGGLPRGEFCYIDGNKNVDTTFAPPPYVESSNDIVHIYSVGVGPEGKITFGGWLTNYPNNTQLNGQDYSGLGKFVGGYTGGAGSLQFVYGSYTVLESGVAARISVSRSGGIAGAVTVNFSTSAGTATADLDYSTTSGQLSWADGEGGVKTFTVPIIDDNAQESTEFFTVNLSSPSNGAVLGAQSSTIVLIADDDSAPTITSQPHDTTVNLSYPALFTVGVGPGLTPTFQWLSNNVAIAGATNSFLRVLNAQTNFVTSYSVVVSNAVGAVTSSSALLTVKIPAGLFDPAFVMPGSGASEGLNLAVYAAAFQSNGVVAVGPFTQFGGSAVTTNIVRLNFDGTLDPSFPAFSTGVSGGFVQCLSQYPDGRWLIAGSFNKYAGTNRFKVARLNPNGSLDLTWSNAAVAASVVAAILPQADGSAYLGESTFVRKFLPNGSNDTTWVNAPMIGQVYALAQQADGKILGAAFKTPQSELVRFDYTGYRDLSFPSITFNGQVTRLLMLKDGRILASGSFGSVTATNGTFNVGNIAVFTATGSYDPSFNVGVGSDNLINDVSLQSDGRILVAGAFSYWNGIPASRYVRLLPTGDIDPSFVVGTGANNAVSAIKADPASGHVVIGGTFTTVNGQPANHIALLTFGAGTVQFTTNFQQVSESAGSVTVSVERPAGVRGAVTVDFTTVVGTAGASDFTPTNGTLSWADGDGSTKTFTVSLNNDGIPESDETFLVQLSNVTGDATLGINSSQTIQILDADSAPRITLQPASATSPEDTSVTFNVAALSATAISYQWRSNNVNILNATNATFTLANVQSNYAASYSLRLTNVNGFTDSSNAVLTVVPSSTRIDLSFATPPFNGIVRAILPLGDGRVMVGGDFTSPKNGIVLLGATGAVDATFTNVATGGTVQVWDIQRDRKGRFLIAGQFAQVAGVTSSNLIRLNPDYSVDRDFITNLNAFPKGVVRNVAVGGDGRIWIGGAFTTVGGPYGLQYAARLNDDGSVDTSFLPKANGAVDRIIPLADGSAFLCGDFTTYGGSSGSMVHVYADGSRDTSYVFSISSATYDMLMRPDGSLLAAGSFTTPSSRIAHFDATGKFDTRYLGGAVGNGNVNSIALQSNGKLIGVGAFTTFGTQSNRFVRFNADGSIDNSIFIGSGFQSSDAYRVAVEPAGQIYVGGAFSTFKGFPVPNFVRLNGEAPTVAIGLQPFDRIVAPGATTTFTISAFGTGTLTYQWMKNGVPVSDGGSISGSTTANLTVTSASGADEGSYSVVVSNGSGASATSLPAALLVRSAPVITQQPVGGIFPVGERMLVKAQVQGAPTVSYQWLKNGSPVGGNSLVYSVNTAATSDSGSYQIVASNGFGSVTSAVAVVTVQLSPATAAAGFYTDAGTDSSSDTVKALQPMRDGRLIVGGFFSALRTNGTTSVSRSYLAAFTTNGLVDPFAPNPDLVVYNAVRQSDGKILVVGQFANIAGNVRHYVARFDTNLNFDTNFSAALGTGPDGVVADIAVQPDGKILLAGLFGSINGQPNTRGIARLNADGSFDGSFASAISASGFGSLVDVAPDGRIYLVANSTYGGVSASVYRLNPDGSVDAAFTNSLGTVSAIAAMPDGSVIVGGTFLTLNGQTRPILARLINNGEVDYNFFAAATNVSAFGQASINSICVQDNGKIIAGGQFLSFGPFRNGLARFNPDGTPDDTFIFQQGYGDSSSGNIARIKTFGDGRIVIGGTFSTWEGVPENNLAILNGDAAGTNTYYNWAADAGLTAANNDPGLDVDADGTPNLFEYYFNGNPLGGAPTLRPINVFVQVNGEVYPALSFVRSKTASGVTLIPKVSSSVPFGNTLGSTFVSATDLGNGTERVIIRSNVSVADDPAQFMEILLQFNP